ncbi:MAG: DUF3955 domain-containing protein [Anaerolineae bacterium]|nr:DUF3955 domain-containing protein [Anaerolineae bacterium]
MKKFIKVTTWLGIGLLIVAVGCIVAYNAIGQSIDADGYLQEPFFLIPLFWLFFFASLVAGGANGLARIIQSRRKVSQEVS